MVTIYSFCEKGQYRNTQIMKIAEQAKQFLGNLVFVVKALNRSRKGLLYSSRTKSRCFASWLSFQ